MPECTLFVCFDKRLNAAAGSDQFQLSRTYPPPGRWIAIAPELDGAALGTNRITES